MTSFETYTKEAIKATLNYNPLDNQKVELVRQNMEQLNDIQSDLEKVLKRLAVALGTTSALIESIDNKDYRNALYIKLGHETCSRYSRLGFIRTQLEKMVEEVVKPFYNWYEKVGKNRYLFNNSMWE